MKKNLYLRYGNNISFIYLKLKYNIVKLVVFKMFFVVFLVFTLNAKGQVTTEVDNGIFVDFPSIPRYSVCGGSLSFQVASSNCIFMTSIQRNVIPNYSEFVQAQKNWSKEQNRQIAYLFLDNVVKGKLDYTGNKGIPSNLMIGNFYGKRLLYSAINPLTGIRGNRESIMLLVRDRLITFDVIYLNSTDDAENEKEDFLNSISTSR